MNILFQWLFDKQQDMPSLKVALDKEIHLNDAKVNVRFTDDKILIHLSKFGLVFIEKINVEFIRISMYSDVKSMLYSYRYEQVEKINTLILNFNKYNYRKKIIRFLNKKKIKDVLYSLEKEMNLYFLSFEIENDLKYYDSVLSKIDLTVRKLIADLKKELYLNDLEVDIEFAENLPQSKYREIIAESILDGESNETLDLKKMINSKRVNYTEVDYEIRELYRIIQKNY